MKRIDFTNITDEMHWEMCDQRFGLPIPLSTFDFDSETTGFVYCREYGVFPCPQFSHQQCMGTIVAWEHGFESYFDMTQNCDYLSRKFHPDLYTVNEFFFTDREGRAYATSELIKGKPDIRYKNRSGLTSIEKRLLMSGGRKLKLID